MAESMQPRARRATARLRPYLGLVGLGVLLLSAPTHGTAGPEKLIVKQKNTSLRARPTEHSRQLKILEAGETLTPLAGMDGFKQRWYLVTTDDSTQGWVRSTQVDGSSRLEKSLRKVAEIPGGKRVRKSSFASGSYGNRAEKVPVQMNGGAIFVPVRLNGSLQTRMVMDTGASLTVITPRVARRLRLKGRSKITLMTANGPISAPVATLASLEVGSAEARDLSVAVHDFAPGTGIGGLLGLNFLRRFETSVDSEKQVLTLKPN